MTREDNSQKALFDAKMNQVQDFIETHKVTLVQKQRMQKFFAY